MPHSEHSVRVSVREMPAAAGPLAECAFSRGAAPGLARLTALGVVLELFVEEEKLFTGGEDELTAAICTG